MISSPSLYAARILLKKAPTTPVLFLCKDYKKDIFAVFAYDFEPSHNFQVLEKSMFYASFPTIAPGLGGSDF
ncbi:MAG: hypothetical protein IKL44_02640, partial [Clostridia bacterium]|nr:hypothetical protein [Clostridia bacterium]